MLKIKFTYPHHSGGYGCNEPGDNSGDYYRTETVDAVIAALRADLDAARAQAIADRGFLAQNALLRHKLQKAYKAMLYLWTCHPEPTLPNCYAGTIAEATDCLVADSLRQGEDQAI